MALSFSPPILKSSQTNLVNLDQFILLHIGKVEKILKGSLDSIPSPSPSAKIQIMGGKVCLMSKGKTLLGIVNKLFIFKSLLTTHSNVLPLHLKQTFSPIIWIFNEGEGDRIEFGLPFKIFSTLLSNNSKFFCFVLGYWLNPEYPLCQHF